LVWEGANVVNFFGFYLDPVYILILTVFLIAGFMSGFIWQLKKMEKTLVAMLKETSLTEAVRVERMESEKETAKVLDALAKQTADLKQHIYNGKS